MEFIMIILLLCLFFVAIVLLIMKEGEYKFSSAIGFVILLIVVNILILIISPVGYVILTIVMIILAAILKLCGVKGELIKVFYRMVKIYIIIYLVALIAFGICMGLISTISFRSLR
ncbi:MAG: hypothetical protein K0R72_306 [Clostridia bacterium]|jgi:hypothetical protein|nr:hypothetical protein [Clostridia bacterium]